VESVLHIEHISRQSPAPLHIGHSDSLFYGEALTIDDENVGDVTSHIRLGAPLSNPDDGSHEAHVPMVKTVEYMPDFSRKEGNVYLETTHFFKDKALVPFRSKMRSRLGMDIRINHLPSLNLARTMITGIDQPVCDPRSEIIADVALRDDIFRRRQNGPLRDWLTHELAPAMDRKPYTTLTFDPDDISRMIPRYINTVRDTPSEYNATHLRAIAETICPIAPSHESIVPVSFLQTTPIRHHIADVRHRLVSNTFDFRSWGVIPIGSLHNVSYNPREFQNVCDLLDAIPLTDINVDMVINLDREIAYYHEHIAVNRFGSLSDVDIGMYTGENVLRHYIDGNVLTDIIYQFVDSHQGMTAEIDHILQWYPVKVKIIKTFSDEAAILLYRHDSSPKDPPLCGVYFDIALQSLAPMSIISMPIPN
jgi:hypothetical protein